MMDREKKNENHEEIEGMYMTAMREAMKRAHDDAVATRLWLEIADRALAGYGTLRVFDK